MDHVAGGCSKLTQKEYKEGMIVHWKLARKCNFWELFNRIHSHRGILEINELSWDFINGPNLD